MANKFSGLRSKMPASVREEARRKTQLMLTESATLQATDFFRHKTVTAKQGDLAKHVLRVKDREPFAGDEMPK